jgi:hypothetical protein
MLRFLFNGGVIIKPKLIVVWRFFVLLNIVNSKKNAPVCTNKVAVYTGSTLKGVLNAVGLQSLHRLNTPTGNKQGRRYTPAFIRVVVLITELRCELLVFLLHIR